MSVEPFMTDIKELDKKRQNQHNTSKILKNETADRSFRKKKSSKPKMTIITRISVRLRRSLSRLQREPDFKTQLDLFESSMSFFIIFGRYLGLFPNISNRKRYPIFSRGYTIPIIICFAQLVVPILILIGLMYTSINVETIFHLSYFCTSFFCSILIICLATKWQELINLIEVADLNEYIDPSVKFKCNIATIAFISFAFWRNVLSVASKLAVLLDCEPNNNTFYGQSSYHCFFKYSVPYTLPFGIMLIILNLIATFNVTYYQIFIICVSLYLQSIMEKINLKIVSFNCEYLSASYWRTFRQDYNRATQLVRSFDEIVNGLVFTLFASSLYFVCLQILYISSKDAEMWLMQDYAQTMTLTYNVYSTIHIIINFLTVSLTVARVHSSSLKVAPVLYNLSPQTYCIEVQRFIEQIQGDPVALTGLNFFYVTKEVILTMIGTIVTYELVLLQLK